VSIGILRLLLVDEEADVIAERELEAVLLAFGGS
jgi:hypothetical protein